MGFFLAQVLSLLFLQPRILFHLPKLSSNCLSLITYKDLVQVIKCNISGTYSPYRPAFQWQRCSGPHSENVKKSLGSDITMDVSICFFLFFLNASVFLSIL